jgi:hypothetical protein
MDLRYPIGKYDWPASLDSAARQQSLATLESFPSRLEEALAGLSPAQLDTPYRDGGWSVRQVVHHLADSHMHSYLRCKFAASEENPIIKAYDEARWARFEDGAHEPAESSLAILTGLHARWVRWFRSLEEGDWPRQFVHPENGPMRLDVTAGLYAWHSRHHLAHITELRRRLQW